MTATVTSWRDISGYPNYQIDDSGNVRNQFTGRVLKTSMRSKGYPSVTLMKCVEGQSVPFKQSCHRLVAEAFVPNADPLTLTWVDHIDRCKTNNHFLNLRWVTPQQNSINRGRHRNNSSGVTGVYFQKSSGKWMAYIRKTGVMTYLGLYDTVEEAEFVRAGVAGVEFGDMAVANNAIRDRITVRTGVTISFD